jgi:hypothetical protein
VKKAILGVAVFAAALAALRLLAPDLKHRAMAKCHAMMFAGAR